jgi:hypothetical protein
MAKGEKHHKDGGSWSSIPAYNTKGAPSESTPCKIKNDTGGAGVRAGSGGGHGASHIHGGRNTSHTNKPNFGHHTARRGY